jgi:hypothetical protein
MSESLAYMRDVLIGSAFGVVNATQLILFELIESSLTLARLIDSVHILQVQLRFDAIF